MAVLGLSETPPATPSSRRRVDGVVHHAFHLADMYLTREAAAYAVICLICGPRGGDDDEASEHEQSPHASKLITKRVSQSPVDPNSLGRKNPSW